MPVHVLLTRQAITECFIYPIFDFTKLRTQSSSTARHEARVQHSTRPSCHSLLRRCKDSQSRRSTAKSRYDSCAFQISNGTPPRYARLELSRCLLSYIMYESSYPVKRGEQDSATRPGRALKARRKRVKLNRSSVAKINKSNYVSQHISLETSFSQRSSLPHMRKSPLLTGIRFWTRTFQD